MTNIFYSFDEQIDTHNKDIETYRKLAPKLLPIIKLYRKELKDVSLHLDYCVLSFPYDETPSEIYHVLDENQLNGRPLCRSGFGFTSMGPTFDEISVSLK